MESAHEAYTVLRELQATWKVARGEIRGLLAAASVSANTRRAYEGALRRLRDWLTGRPLDDATLAAYPATRFDPCHSSAVAS